MAIFCFLKIRKTLTIKGMWELQAGFESLLLRHLRPNTNLCD